MTRIEFDVRGLPVPQGSPRAFVAGGRAIVATDASRSTAGRSTSPLAAWRHAIATEARDAIRGEAPIVGPVRVRLEFRFPRPKSHWLPANARRPRPELRVDAPSWLTSKPDADKVARAALDALTGVVFGDDAQVADLRVIERYAMPGEGPGVDVVVASLEEPR
jgi:crossover junction endodeoxyribonuclease RusA